MACFYLFHCVRYRPDPFGKKFGADVVQKEGKDKDQKQDAQYIFLQNLYILSYHGHGKRIDNIPGAGGGADDIIVDTPVKEIPACGFHQFLPGEMLLRQIGRGGVVQKIPAAVNDIDGSLQVTVILVIGLLDVHGIEINAGNTDTVGKVIGIANRVRQKQGKGIGGMGGITGGNQLKRGKIVGCMIPAVIQEKAVFRIGLAASELKHIFLLAAKEEDSVQILIDGVIGLDDRIV